MSTSPPKHDSLFGLGAIAAFIHQTPAATKELIAAGKLPGIYEIGTMPCGSKVELRAWRTKRDQGEAQQ